MINESDALLNEKLTQIDLFENDENQVEKELGNDDVEIVEPFDPQKINIKIVPLTIGQLVDKLQYEEVKVPEYQRKSGLWDSKRKSRFIESLMLRLPIPLFYFDERKLDIWWVVDGLQRVTTIREFVLDKKFKLSNLEFLKKLNGLGWEDLERNYQRNINQSQITINLIQKDTPEKVKHNIFRRINQGSIELSSQELRTALLWGYRIDFLKELVRGDSKEAKMFLKVTDNRVKVDRQEDLDFASRFVAFYLKGYQKYEPDMDNFLTEGTLLVSESKSEQEKIRLAFYQALEVADSIFGNDAFRRRTNMSDPNRKPINKPLFEALSIAFSMLNDSQKNNLIKNKVDFYQSLINKQLTDKSFLNSISTGTATKESVNKRNKEIGELIKLYCND